MATNFNTNHLTPHEAISDALIRNAMGIDDNNPTLMASAFTADAIQDMTAFTFLNPHFGLTTGRDAIIAMASASVGKMDTTHMLSNFRTTISLDGKSAHLTCYALAQYWWPGQGKHWAFDANLLMGNRYEGDLVFDGEVWRLRKFVVRPAWSKGDSGVFDEGSWEGIREGVKMTVG